MMLCVHFLVVVPCCVHTDFSSFSHVLSAARACASTSCLLRASRCAVRLAIVPHTIDILTMLQGSCRNAFVDFGHEALLARTYLWDFALAPAASIAAAPGTQLYAAKLALIAQRAFLLPRELHQFLGSHGTDAQMLLDALELGRRSAQGSSFSTSMLPSGVRTPRAMGTPTSSAARQHGACVSGAAAFAACAHAAAALRPLLRSKDALQLRTDALAPLLQAAAAAMPAAAAEGCSRAKSAASQAADQACQSLCVLFSRHTPTLELHRDVLARVVAHSSESAAAAFAAVLQCGSYASQQVQTSACWALAALQPTPQHAEAMLCGAAGHKEAVAGSFSASYSMSAGVVLVQGLVSRLQMADQQASANCISAGAHLQECTPLTFAGRNLPQADFANPRQKMPSQAFRYKACNAAHARSSLAALRCVLAYSTAAKEYVIEHGFHLQWLEAVQAACRQLSNGVESGVRSCVLGHCNYQ